MGRLLCVVFLFDLSKSIDKTETHTHTRLAADSVNSMGPSSELLYFIWQHLFCASFVCRLRINVTAFGAGGQSGPPC